MRREVLSASTTFRAAQLARLTGGQGLQNCCSSFDLKAGTPVKLKCVSRSKRLSMNVAAPRVIWLQYDKCIRSRVEWRSTKA